MGSEADSWVGTGPNEQLSANQVGEVIDEQEIDQIARELGVSHEEACQAIAQVLPELVDRASPHGHLPEQHDLDDLFGQLAGAGSR